MQSKFDLVDPTYSSEFFFPGGETGVLLIHGYTASPASMLPLGRALSEQGYTVLGVRLPGHAETVEAMEKTGWRDWLSACRDRFNRLAETCREIFVVGHSMGGTLTLLLAEELPLSGAVSICAPVKIYGRAIGFARFIWPFWRYRRFSDQPYTGYEAAYNADPVRCLGHLNKLMKLSMQGISRITCPLLVVQARGDRTVQPESGEMIYAGAKNAGLKKMLWLEESGHICTVKPEFNRLLSGITDFFADCLPGR